MNFQYHQPIISNEENNVRFNLNRSVVGMSMNYTALHDIIAVPAS